MDTPKKAYFFATCLIDLLYPNAGLAGMQLIRRAGWQVSLPANQTCCGQPAYNSGYRKQALQVARAQLDCFPEAIPLVVPSASCAGMFRHHWPTLFAGEADEPRAIALAERTYELTEFLVKVLDLSLDDLGEPVRVAIHHSCSATREMAVTQHLETLLSRLSNVETMPPVRAAECCGFGGTFAIKQADISGAMAEAKADALQATGADRVVSQDCGCLENIRGIFARRQQGLPTEHIAEFLWRRTAGETS